MLAVQHVPNRSSNNSTAWICECKWSFHVVELYAWNFFPSRIWMKNNWTAKTIYHYLGYLTRGSLADWTPTHVLAVKAWPSLCYTSDDPYNVRLGPCYCKLHLIFCAYIFTICHSTWVILQHDAWLHHDFIKYQTRSMLVYYKLICNREWPCFLDPDRTSFTQVVKDLALIKVSLG